MGPRGKRVKKSPRQARQETRVLVLIFLLVVVLVSLSTILVAWSSRPDLYYVVPPASGDGARAVTWDTLDRLWLIPGGPESARKDLFEGEVRVAGYMVPSDKTRQPDGGVAKFLLVPDPGNWLHPPHLDPGEVLDVMLKGGAATQLLDRKAVVVRGTLSVQRLDPRSREATYHLLASDVQVLQK